jgi:hypothetical protein
MPRRESRSNFNVQVIDFYQRISDQSNNDASNNDAAEMEDEVTNENTLEPVNAGPAPEDWPSTGGNKV